MKRAPPVQPAAAAPKSSGYPGLDLLPAAVLLLDGEFRINHANPAAEALFESSLRHLQGQPVDRLTQSEELGLLLDEALQGKWSHRTQEIEVWPPGRDPILVACVVTPAMLPSARRALAPER